MFVSTVGPTNSDCIGGIIEIENPNEWEATGFVERRQQGWLVRFVSYLSYGSRSLFDCCTVADWSVFCASCQHDISWFRWFVLMGHFYYLLIGHVYNCLFSLLDKDCSNIVNFGFVSAFFCYPRCSKEGIISKVSCFPTICGRIFIVMLISRCAILYCLRLNHLLEQWF